MRPVTRFPKVENRQQTEIVTKNRRKRVVNIRAVPWMWTLREQLPKNDHCGNRTFLHRVSRHMFRPGWSSCEE